MSYLLPNARTPMPGRGPASLAVAFLVLAACSPTLRVQAPDKPIEINLNVNIRQEVILKLDKAVEDLISKNPDIF